MWSTAVLPIWYKVSCIEYKQLKVYDFDTIYKMIVHNLSVVAESGPWIQKGWEPLYIFTSLVFFLNNLLTWILEVSHFYFVQQTSFLFPDNSSFHIHKSSKKDCKEKNPHLSSITFRTPGISFAAPSCV